MRKLLRRLTQSKLISWSLDKTSLLGKCKALSRRLIAQLVDYMWHARIDQTRPHTHISQMVADILLRAIISFKTRILNL